MPTRTLCLLGIDQLVASTAGHVHHTHRLICNYTMPPAAAGLECSSGHRVAEALMKNRGDQGMNPSASAVV